MENLEIKTINNIRTMVNPLMIYSILDYLQSSHFDTGTENCKILNKKYLTYIHQRRTRDFSDYLVSNLKHVTDVFKKAETMCWPQNEMDFYTDVNNLEVGVFCDSDRNLYKINLRTENIIKKVPTKHSRIILSVRHFKIRGKDYIVTTSKDHSLERWDDELNYKLSTLYPHGLDSFLISSLLIENKQNNNEEKFDYFVTCGYMSKEVKIRMVNLEEGMAKEESHLIKMENKVLGIEKFEYSGVEYLLIVTNTGVDCRLIKEEKVEEIRQFNANGHSLLSICTVDNKIIGVESNCDVNIWDFLSGERIRTFSLATYKISTLDVLTATPWNENNILIGCRDNSMRVINLLKEEEIKTYELWGTKVSTIKKLNHPVYGPCLYVYNDSNISVWA